MLSKTLIKDGDTPITVYYLHAVVTKTPIRDGDTRIPVYDLHMPPVTITLVFSHVNLTHNNNIVSYDLSLSVSHDQHSR